MYSELYIKIIWKIAHRCVSYLCHHFSLRCCWKRWSRGRWCSPWLWSCHERFPCSTITTCPTSSAATTRPKYNKTRSADATSRRCSLWPIWRPCRCKVPLWQTEILRGWYTWSYISEIFQSGRVKIYPKIYPKITKTFAKCWCMYINF